MINLKLGKGQDVVVISGMVSHFHTREIYNDVLHIHNQKNADNIPDDTLSFYDMIKNMGELEGINGLSVFEIHNGKMYICYTKRYVNTSEFDDKNCPIQLSHVPAVFASSPLDDRIFLRERYPMEIRNRKGRNEYVVLLKLAELTDYSYSLVKYYYQIMDSSGIPMKFKIGTIGGAISESQNIEVTYSDEEKVFNIYTKLSNKITLLRRVMFGSACEAPLAISIEDVDMLLEHVPRIPESVVNKDFEETSEDTSYFFDKNLRYTSDRQTIHKTCLCKPHGSVEAYSIIDMGDGLDIVTIDSNLFISGGEYTKNTINLVWVKTSGTFDWVFQYRAVVENQPKAVQRPHFDIILRDVELISFSGTNQMTIDLTDKANVKPNIDLITWDKHFKYFALGAGLHYNIGSEYDDIIIITTSQRISHKGYPIFDLGAGTDTVIIAWNYLATAGNENEDLIQYRIREADDGSLTIYLKFDISEHRGEYLKVFNADRVACQYNGIIKTLPDWDIGKEMTEPKDLTLAACEMDDYTLADGTKFKEITPREESYFDSCSCYGDPNETSKKRRNKKRNE